MKWTAEEWKANAKPGMIVTCPQATVTIVAVDDKEVKFDDGVEAGWICLANHYEPILPREPEPPTLLTADDCRRLVRAGDVLRFEGGDVEVTGVFSTYCESTGFCWSWSRLAIIQPEIIKPAAPDPEPCECVVGANRECPADLGVSLPMGSGYREGDTVRVEFVRRAAK